MRILHVDDDLVPNYLVKHNLQSIDASLECTWVDSGEKALELLAETTFDCILSDYQMPVMNGMEFLKKLRERGDTTPFIFLTGQGNEQIASEAFLHGANDYLTKEEGFAHYIRMLNSIKNLIKAHALNKERIVAEERLREVEQIGKTAPQNVSEETYFASAERTSAKELVREINIIQGNPVLTGLLKTVSGLLAILDANRQVLSVNVSFLEMIGVEEPEKVLGLRLGEILNCVHAKNKPHGCGTTKYCSTCGAAIAMVTSLTKDISVERICALTAKRGDVTIELALLVRAQPIVIDNVRFLLLFIQDITLQQHRAALERKFCRDIKSMIDVMVKKNDLLISDNMDRSLAQVLSKMLMRLQKEIAIQHVLLTNQAKPVHTLWESFELKRVIEELQAFFVHHHVSQNKSIQWPESVPDIFVTSDISLVLHVLCNMVTNALEATEETENIRVWLENTAQTVTFCVWNKSYVPKNVSLRIFQRNFSTKEDAGRGNGTFAMKLFGEKTLGGKVSFTSSKSEGTIFRFEVVLIDWRAEHSVSNSQV